MGHNKDYWEGVRNWVVPKLGLISQWIEDFTGKHYYVTATTHNNQFVGRVPMNDESFEEVLHDLGFERNPLAVLKTLEDGEPEESSWRKVGYDEHPDMQLHVILYDGERIESGDAGYTYVYAHWEMRWDVAPLTHYRAVNKNTGEGVRRMKKLLDEYGVRHEAIRP